MFQPSFRFFGIVSLAVCLAGCTEPGPKIFSVKGKVTIGGQPAKDLQLNFYPVDSSGTMASAMVKADGSYELISGIENRLGVAPGKYKVVLAQVASSGMTKGAAAPSMYTGGTQGKSASGPPEEGKAPFPKEYGSAETSPKEVEVKAQANTIDIAI